MELYLKITVGLFLFVQAFHPASFQDSTDSPGRTIDKAWLRKLAINTTGSPQAAEDVTTMGASSGIASGSMATLSEEEEEEQDLIGQDKDANKTSDDLTVIVTSLDMNGTTNQPELPSTTVSPDTTVPRTSSQITVANNDSAMTSQPTTTNVSTNVSNPTTVQLTTWAPQTNATQASTTKPLNDTGLANSTGSNSTTTVANTATPETLSTSSSTTVFPSETAETSTVTMTTTAVNTPVKANKTDKDAASESGSGRGWAPQPHNNRYVAWAAVLGTGVAVACAGLVAYIILKNRRDKGFFHRKLVEEYPSDPVLRLDNNEPLDLNFGGSAYYNPGLQGDNIQMTNFPGHR